MIFALILLVLVNAASHLVLVQSSKLIMMLAERYFLEERVIKSITREIILDLQSNNIEKVFHLPRVDQFIKLTYHPVERWYREHVDEASKIM